MNNKLGPILFQSPPSWVVNIGRLQAFLKALPKQNRYTFEFRNRTWLCQAVFDLLANFDAALCFYDYKGYQCAELVTTDFIYLRLHGPEVQPYQGGYSTKSLNNYASKFMSWKSKVKRIYCYFDNDQKACAPNDARRLLDNLKKQD